MEEDVFNAFADALALPELIELKTAASTWTCACGESNPSNILRMLEVWGPLGSRTARI